VGNEEINSKKKLLENPPLVGQKKGKRGPQAWGWGKRGEVGKGGC